MLVPHRRVCASGRHPDFYNAPDQGRTVQPRLEVEKTDARYKRTDMSAAHRLAARRAFAAQLSRGEAGIRLATAALLMAAEDDAIVDAYLARVERIVDELACSVLPALGPSAAAAQVLEAVEEFVYGQQRFRAAPCGRSALPVAGVVDHPGVYEDARLGYLNELLVRRQGHPSAVAILMGEIFQRLLQQGSIGFAVTVDGGDFSVAPRLLPLEGLSRSQLVATDGCVVNTLASDALSEVNRHLKRAYWPFAWDTRIDSLATGGAGSHGGFRSAAKAALGDEMGAALRAISTVARWRLERGIWTSPGAGDIRRCIPACERLVMMAGSGIGGIDAATSHERRDLAVMLLHNGEVARAYAELQGYAATDAFRLHSDPFDRQLCRQLLDLLRSTMEAGDDHSADSGSDPGSGGGGGGGSGLRPCPWVVSTEAVLQGAPDAWQDDDVALPLTW